VTLADDRRVVVKTGGGDPELEAEGLDALREAGAPTPAVLGRTDALLVLEFVAGPENWNGLGRALAQCHRATSDRFGWHRDNLIASLPQHNDRADRWSDFYLEHRLTPLLPALPVQLRLRLEAAMTHRLPGLLDHDVRPSLLHGDLWSGNIVAGRWLIDPAVHYGDRELDLAMLDLFGSIPAAMQKGYDAVWPLDSGWQERRPALQLYHLLVHVQLFGSGYHRAVASRLDAIEA